jgi:dephospho-CoA kinase
VYLVGLTGGIAAGKSSVAARWVQLGAIEIDADVLARQAVEPGSQTLGKIAELFGAQTITADGELDRAVVAQIVFNDPTKRQQLEQIIHPRVRELAQQRIQELPADAIAVYTVPLLVEANVSLPFDMVVTVEAPQQEQIKRMVANRGMSEAEALARIKSQATPAQRANRADVILNSNQTLAELLADADALWTRIVREASEKQGD